jgi:site-specific DNA-adenine methylase
LTEIWGTVPQWISAATAGGALFIAWKASAAWQKTLIARRGDDLLAAAHDVAASFYKLSAAVGRKVARDSFGRHVDEAYVDFRELRKAYAIAQRSYPKLTDAILKALSDELDEMKEAGTLMYVDPNHLITFGRAAKEAQAKGDEFVETVKQILAAP